MAVAVALVGVTPAKAIPGDPPIESISPADGKVFATSQQGIPVRVTCPQYRPSQNTTAGPERYSVVFATQRRADGTLAPPGEYLGGFRLDPVPDQPGACQGWLPSVRGRPGAQTPGIYFWQGYRRCFDCPEGYEGGPVRSIVIRQAVPKLKLVVRGRAYGGYPLSFGVTTSDVPDGTEVTLERRARAGGWVTLGRDRVSSGAGKIIAALPTGAHAVRLTASVNGQRFNGTPTNVRAQRARRWRTSRRDDGEWRGRAGGAQLSFRVSGGGRLLTGLETEVPAFCVGPSIDTNTSVVALVAVPRVRIAPDGSILSRYHHAGTTILLRGRLTGGRLVGGEAEIEYSTCAGKSKLTARR